MVRECTNVLYSNSGKDEEGRADMQCGEQDIKQRQSSVRGEILFSSYTVSSSTFRPF